jgi:hypothetical protein
MKRKDIIQLIKNAIKENAYGHATLTTQGPPRTGAIAPTDEYPFSVRPKRTGTGMMEFQQPKSFDPDTINLVREMLLVADIHHNELVEGYDEVSSYLDKRTGGTIIKFPHFNGPQGRGALFGKETSNQIDSSKAKAKLAAIKTKQKFQTYVDDFEISDKSPAGVYGNIYLWVMFNDLAKDYSAPKGGTQSTQFESLDEIKVDYDFSERELVRIVKQLKRGASTEVDMIKAFEKSLGREITDKELFKEAPKGGTQSSQFENKQNKNKMKNIKEADVSGLEKAAIEAEKKAIEMKIKALNDKKTKMATGTDSVVEGEYEGDSFGSAGTDKRTGQVIGEILQLIRSTGVDPADVMEEIGQAFGVSFEFGRAFEGKEDDDEQDIDDVKQDIAGMMEGYMKKRAGSNLMEHMDTYRKRALLMEGAMKKFFEMFDHGKTDEEIVLDYAKKGTTVPEPFVTKARRQYEGMKKLKLELEMSEKEFRNSSEKMVNNAEEGMEYEGEEKTLASGLTNEQPNEGNAFGLAMQKAKAAGEDSFELDGETIKV